MGKQKPIEEIKAGWSGLNRPKDGHIYRHYKGGKYEIVATGFIEANEAPCVVYRSLAEGVVWVRPAKNFLEGVEHEGSAQPRFRLVEC